MILIFVIFSCRMATKEIQERVNRLEMMIRLLEDPVQV